MIAFMSGSSSDGTDRSDYFLSPPCQQELRRAVAGKTPIIWVLETDPLHGGIPLSSHLADCPDDLHGALEAAIAGQEVIEWHRIRSFQDTSLRLILQRVLAVEAEERSQDLVYVPTEVTRAPLRLKAPPPPCHFHVYVSEHNPGAAELMAELERWLELKHKKRGKTRSSITLSRKAETTKNIVCGPWAMLRVPLEAFGIEASLADNLCGGSYSAIGVTLGRLSPLAAVTLPPHVRDAVGIARDALYFAFAYPSDAESMAAAEAEMGHAEDLADLEGLTGGAKAAATALKHLGRIGGFMYFKSGEDGALKLCQANALALASTDERRQLHFAGPVPLGKFASVMRDSLHRAGRLHAVTVPALLEAGVRFFAWLHANEKLGLPCEGEWPDGAFAYFYEDEVDGLSARRQDCLFYLTQGPPADLSGSTVTEEQRSRTRRAKQAQRESGLFENSWLHEAWAAEAASFDGLRCTDDPEHVLSIVPTPSHKNLAAPPLTRSSIVPSRCSHVLVYLNAETHSHPTHSAKLHQELDRLLKARHHFVLVHESRPEHHAASFKSIIDATPKHLVRDEFGAKRLYQELAVPIYPGEHFDVSATLLLNALAGAQGSGKASRLQRLRLMGQRRPPPPMSSASSVADQLNRSLSNRSLRRTLTMSFSGAISLPDDVPARVAEVASSDESVRV